MKNLESTAEKILKKLIKKGEIEVLDEKEYNEIFDKVDEDMENFRIDENYRKGMSRIEIEKLPDYIQNTN
jgi:hypothetical protein